MVDRGPLMIAGAAEFYEGHVPSVMVAISQAGKAAPTDTGNLVRRRGGCGGGEHRVIQLPNGGAPP